MGQKTHPTGFRLGISNKTWQSRWLVSKGIDKLIQEDRLIRKTIKKKLYSAGISRVDIERKADQLGITIFAAKPGVVVGRGGQGIDALRHELAALTRRKLQLDVQEIPNVETDAQMIAEAIAQQLEKRVAFRRAMKQAISRAMKAGAQGIKVMVAGRLGGAEIARTEWLREGRIPLQTLRADIDYGFAEARTVMGAIGVKAWIFKGEIMPDKKEKK